MTLNDITQTILDEANEKKAAIERETRERVTEIANETERLKKEYTQDHNAQLERDIEHRREQTRARATQEVQRERERTKRSEIDDVYTQVYTKLTNCPSEEYTSLVTRLAEELPKDLDGTVHVPRERQTETQQALASAGITLSNTPSDAISGGFIATTDTAEYDYSFEKLVTHAREKTELEVAQTLFTSPNDTKNQNDTKS